MDVKDRLEAAIATGGRIVAFLLFLSIWELFTGLPAYNSLGDGQTVDVVIGGVFGLLPLLVAAWWLYTRYSGRGALLSSGGSGTRS